MRFKIRYLAGLLILLLVLSLAGCGKEEEEITVKVVITEPDGNVIHSSERKVTFGKQDSISFSKK